MKGETLQRPATGRPGSVAIATEGPFDLSLSLAAAASFLPPAGPLPTALRQAVRVADNPSVIDIWQPSRAASALRASAVPAIEGNRLRELARWLAAGDLDLRPFYRLVAEHPLMGPVAAALHGLKPLRPASLFEMAVIAITEQQLSLASAFHIRSRLVNRFGSSLAGLPIFPEPEALAHAALVDLRGCGLSQRKAEYVREVARHAANGAFDHETLRRQSDAAAREALLRIRGFGEWSIEYFLLRGLGRPDCLPVADVGLRRVIGMYFGDGMRLSPQALELAMLPFRPFRGLAAFYLSVHWRLRRGSRA